MSQKSVIPVIESVYDNFTNVERNIADFFIHNKEKTNFSARAIAEKLYTSEASLSRFAQKCGFRGYREFIFRYQDSFVSGSKPMDDSIELILNTYQELLNKSSDLVDEKKLRRVSDLLTSKKRVYVYGKGSSGLAANEMKLRFMRIGVDIESITDDHIMKINSVRLDPECLVIGISISGRTTEVISALAEAKRREAATMLITSKNQKEYRNIIDELLLIPVKENLEYGNVISPQFPVLVMVDMIYASFLRYDKENKEAIYDYTLHKLKPNLDGLR